jgi:hypothetical protein
LLAKKMGGAIVHHHEGDTVRFDAKFERRS